MEDRYVNHGSVAIVYYGATGYTAKVTINLENQVACHTNCMFVRLSTLQMEKAQGGLVRRGLW